MAQVKEISVSVRFTKNLGNYENIVPSASIVMTVEEGDDLKEVYEKAWDIVGDEVLKQLELFKEERSGRGR